MLHLAAVEPATLELLKKLQSLPELRNTRLVGGTALDIAFLLRLFSLNEILGFYSTKYNDGSVFMAMKSMVYFEDAEKDPMPDMFINQSWEQVKEYILSKIS